MESTRDRSESSVVNIADLLMLWTNYRWSLTCTACSNSAGRGSARANGSRSHSFISPITMVSDRWQSRRETGEIIRRCCLANIASKNIAGLLCCLVFHSTKLRWRVRFTRHRA